MEQERLLPSSPSLHAAETQADVVSCEVVRGEETPLLGGTKGEVGKEGKRWSWRSLALVAVLWFAVLFISAAYSMIAPFFPREVCLLIQQLIYQAYQTITISVYCTFTV